MSQKKSYFLYHEDAVYVVKSIILYLGQFLMDPDEIWYKSRATTHCSVTHKFSSWSEEKWQRYGTWSISQGILHQAGCKLFFYLVGNWLNRDLPHVLVSVSHCVLSPFSEQSSLPVHSTEIANVRLNSQIFPFLLIEPDIWMSRKYPKGCFFGNW